MKAKTAKQKAAIKAAQLAAAHNNAAALQEAASAIKGVAAQLRLAIRDNDAVALDEATRKLKSISDSAPARMKGQVFMVATAAWHHALRLAARLNRFELAVTLAIGPGLRYVAMGVALMRGHLALFEALLANAEPQLIACCETLLRVAAQRGKADFVAVLLTQEPLRALEILVPLLKHCAANMEMVETLARGADHLYGRVIDPTNASGEDCEVEGLNLLMFACASGDMKLVRLLLPVSNLDAVDSRGGDVDTWASGNEWCMKLLAQERARRAASVEAVELAGVVWHRTSIAEGDSPAPANMSVIGGLRERPAIRI